MIPTHPWVTAMDGQMKRKYDDVVHCVKVANGIGARSEDILFVDGQAVFPEYSLPKYEERTHPANESCEHCKTDDPGAVE